MLHKYAAAVVGARGYSGQELCRLLLAHPHADLQGVFATDSAFALSDLLLEPAARKVATWKMADFEQHMKSGLHTVFLATPAEVSMELAPIALQAGVNVIDLSGAFRLKGESSADVSDIYNKWYKFKHAHPELVQSAQFGLQPFAKPLSGKGPRLVSNPGCYATAASMALIPLLKAGVITADSIVIDAKSGTTGAGRKAEESLLFSEVEGDFRAYKVGCHQHTPEIQSAVQWFAGAEIAPFFTTQLMNVRRGIMACIYANVAGDVKNANARVAKAFADAYENYPLVRVAEISAGGASPMLSMKKVVGTARVHLAFKVEGSKLYLFSMLDNLLKGAASQAVENFNHLLDAPLETGLSNMEGVL
jgi:N-acetyl-gamma-glutamyl-phosphate reductase